MWNFTKVKNKVLIKDKVNKITTQDLNIFSNNLTLKIGKKKKLVFLICDNVIGSVLGYLSLLTSRHVPVMLDKSISYENLKNLIDIYNPDFIWCPNNMRFDKNIKFAYFKYKLVTLNNKIKKHIHDDLCLLASTSGSTGSPKFVRQSFDNITSNTKSILRTLPITHKDITITTLPMSYTFGMSIINTHISKNSTIILNNNSIIQKNFWEIFSKEKITCLYGVPFTFEMLDKVNFFDKNHNYINFLAQAGGSLNYKLHKKINKFSISNKIKFFSMYGQAEASTRISCLNNNLSNDKIGSIGKVIPGGKMWLQSKSGKVINKNNSIGHLHYKGKNVCMGYSDNLDDLKKGYEWQYLNTGDLGRRDNQGYYYITGRFKRFVKIFGLNINLDDLQKILQNYFKKIEFAITGRENKVNIFYLAEKNYCKEIINLIAKKTKLNKGVFSIYKIKKFPRLSSGKISFKSLKMK